MKSSTLVSSWMFLGLVMSGSGIALGQDTLRVVYHDFQWQHPDFGGPPGTDPVQQKCNGALGSNIVQNVLPPNKIPLPTTNPTPSPNSAAERAECLDLNIASWFAPTAGTTGFLRTFPGYLLENGTGSRANDGLFVFDSQSFFPIDTVTGAQIYSNGHNNLFCLEVHENFRYVGGEVFDFRGDDDVWLYINNRLAIDLGGLHGPLSSTLNLDARATSLGIVRGNTYDFDFYYCERQFSQSSIRITTNIPIASSKVSKPVADPAGKSFDIQENVKLTTLTPAADIFYTTNGATPDSNSTLYTGPILVTTTTTIKAIAIRAGWTPSDVMTEVYTKNFNASVLDILDQFGNPLVNGYLTELNAAYMVKISTTQAALGSITPGAATQVGDDEETLTLANPSPQGGRLVYTGTSPFSNTAAAGAATPNDAKTQAATYDSLTVTWVNPVNAADVASKSVLVRPAPKQASAYFSSKADGTDTKDQFAGTEGTIYLFIVDQVLPSGAVPTVILTTTPKLGSRTADVDTFNLVTVSPGLYRATIPVDLVSANAVKGDDKLQLALEDQILGSYKDPLDGDVAEANAGFGIAPEIGASLQFTDKDGKALPDGIFYSPAEGRLYLTYRDDWVNGSILKKIVTLTIVNNSGRAGSDAETTFVLDTVSHTGSTGVWGGSFALKDGPSITIHNDTADTYVLGVVSAVVTAHTKSGGTQSSATDELKVAYANENPVIGIESPRGPGLVISRADTGVIITIKDQSLSTARDTLYATLSCTVSGDVVSNVMLIEKEGKPGEYESFPLGKSEGEPKSGGTLQCLSSDYVKVRYQDPVYGDPKETIVLIDNPVTTRLYFSSKADGSDEITSVDELEDSSFYAVVLARSPNVSTVDSFQVTFTTPQGEIETFFAIETGAYTEKFIVKVPFAFVFTAPAKDNDVLEGKITAKEVSNYVTATGRVTVGGSDATQTLDLVAGFAPVQKAYIKDTNGDGRADQVYIVFERKLGYLPAKVEAQWNEANAASTKTAPKISFLDTDSNVVVADFTSSPFGAGLTAVADGQIPQAFLPEGALFKGQSPAIEDSIGPILLTAVKHPVNVNALVGNDPSYNLDTLVVTLSEPLKTADFKNVLKFSNSCDDYENAKTIEAVQNPTASATEPTTYRVIFDNTTGLTPLVGNCIFLNADPGRYSDIHENPPPEYGVVLTGANRDRIIQLVRGYPPVAGLDPNNATYYAANRDPLDSTKGGYASPAEGNTWSVNWIPPAGFSEGGTYVPYKANLNDLPSGSKESTRPTSLPRDISAIQVVSTAAYIAHISIFDNHGNFVRSSVQAFGGRGELQNQSRVVPKGLVSYLVWDMRDRRGQLAGQGVYVWKIAFEFKGGKQEVQYTRTGVVRK